MTVSLADKSAALFWSWLQCLHSFHTVKNIIIELVSGHSFLDYLRAHQRTLLLSLRKMGASNANNFIAHIKKTLKQAHTNKMQVKLLMIPLHRGGIANKTAFIE